MKPIALVPLFLCWAAQLAAQPLPSWRHYTLDDGLPSNTLYGMAEDHDGYLWFSTNAGICRFNGYEFQQFPAPDEVNSLSVFMPQTDAQGRVWFCTSNGKLYYFERDSIRAWPHNHLLDQFKGKINLISNYGFRPDGSTMIELPGIGLLLVRPDGSHQVLETDYLSSMYAEFAFGFRGMNNPTTPQQVDFQNKHYYSKGTTMPIVLLKMDGGRDTLPPAPNVENRGGPSMILRVGRDTLIGFSSYNTWLWANGRLLAHAPRDTSLPENFSVTARHLADGRLYVSRIKSGAGLYVYQTTQDALHDRPAEVLLPGMDVAFAWLGQQGGLWATTLKQGIFYRPSAAFAVWNAQNGLPSNGVAHLAADGHRRVFVGTDQHRLFSLDVSGNTSPIEITIPEKDPYLNYLFFDSLSQRLCVGFSMKNVLTWGKQGWKRSFWWTEDKPAMRFLNRQLLLSRDGRRFFGMPTGGGVDIADAATGRILTYGDDRTHQRAVCIAETPDGQLLASLPEGLHFWRDSAFVPVPGLPAPLTRRVRAMEWLPDSTLVAGTNAGGVCLWKGAFFRQITTADGLTSDRVTQLAVQGDSIVWAGGNLGLNKITGWRPGQTLRVEHITVAHGLPSNEINDLCVADGYLWAATGSGLARIRNLPMRHESPAPHLVGLWVNGEKMKIGNGETAKSGGGNFTVSQFPISFSATENNLEFRFLTLNYRQNGRIAYRFRLNPDARWQHGQATSAVFSALAPGRYRFEVQSENESGIWSQSLVLHFRVRPPWWADWPFRAFMAVLLGGAALAFYKWRTGQLKQAFALLQQLSELEQTALRAQMNPHFIFNCLNSVQRCIADGQTDDALRYLARFAKLVRQVLSLSGLPAISLATEIEYLETYLNLEKMRFKERFDFTIEAEPTLEPSEIRLPPMLVQPLAENALLHGLSGKKSGGMIRIAFAKNEAGQLKITVADNGFGLAKPDDTETKRQEPHGLAILRRRLELGGQTGKKAAFDLHENLGADGTATGTQAVLCIELVIAPSGES